MAITEQDFDTLKEEAGRLHFQYREIKEANRGRTMSEEDRIQVEFIRRRYAEIESQLNAADNHTAEEISRLSNFDIEPYRAHKPIPVDDSDEHLVGRFFAAASPRFLITSVLALFLVSLFALISHKQIGFFVVPTSSMEPTLIPNDKLVTIRKPEYERGDIVVILDPLEEGSYLVKRIVAKGNDDIFVNRGKVIVNSQPIEEPYVIERIGYEFGPYRIPEDEIFVLGDNRNHSDDGHHWGRGVPTDSIIGQVKYIYGPSERLQAIPEIGEIFVPAGT